MRLDKKEIIAAANVKELTMQQQNQPNNNICAPINKSLGETETARYVDNNDSN
jgi:hypothetical protein